MLAQTQRLRRLAVHVLLAWLFALSTGIVNACVVQAGLPNSADSVAHGNHEAVKALDQAEVSGGTGDDHESHPGNPPCERCCDEPSALPQAAKQHSEPLNGFWLASAPAPSFTFQAVSEANGTLDSRHIRWRAAIPISIAFLRLTL